MGPRGTWPDPEPVTGELVTCQPDCRLEALRLAVATAAGLGAAAVLRTARDYLDWLTARPQGVPPGDAAETRAALATITKQLEAVMTALDNLKTADTNLKTEVTTAIADWAAQLAASSAASDPAIQAVADDMQAQVTALQAADTTAAPAAPPAAPSGTSN